jgi:hypothetical protein
MGNVKPLLFEQDSQTTPKQGDKPVVNQNTNYIGNSLINKVGTEGLKYITPQMVEAPPFKGTYSGYVIQGEFNGVEYTWDCHGVTNFNGVRGIVEGSIGTETIENMCTGLKIEQPTDAKPKSFVLQFASKSGTKFIIYSSTSGKVICLNY